MEQPPEKVNQQKEVEVKDEYERYDPNKSGTTEGLSLKIFTRYRNKYTKPRILCGVCQKEVTLCAGGRVCGRAGTRCKRELAEKERIEIKKERIEENSSTYINILVNEFPPSGEY